MNNKTVIIIVGPTAVGKTALSLQLAQYFNTAIISADSRQCYKELNIGVAKPSPQELLLAKHYFINSHTITDEVNTGSFEQYALNAADEIFQSKNTAIMVGGTGLYIKAFCEGIDLMPEIPAAIRTEISDNYKLKGLTWLQEEVKKADVNFWNIAEQQNPQRLMRALEVKMATGKSINTFRRGEKIARPFNVIKVGLQLPKQTLHQHIHQRVDNMMETGLLNEVKSLLLYRNLNALQTVGYRELFDYIDGKCSLDTAVEQIKINTRHYAKRQITWFKRDKEIEWFNTADNEHIFSYIKNVM